MMSHHHSHLCQWVEPNSVIDSRASSWPKHSLSRPQNAAGRIARVGVQKIAGSFPTAAEGRGRAAPPAQRWIPDRQGDADEEKLQNAQGAAIANLRIKIIERNIAAAPAAAALRAKVSKF